MLFILQIYQLLLKNKTADAIAKILKIEKSVNVILAYFEYFLLQYPVEYLVKHKRKIEIPNSKKGNTLRNMFIFCHLLKINLNKFDLQLNK